MLVSPCPELRGRSSAVARGSRQTQGGGRQPAMNRRYRGERQVFGDGASPGRDRGRWRREGCRASELDGHQGLMRLRPSCSVLCEARGNQSPRPPRPWKTTTHPIHIRHHAPHMRWTIARIIRNQSGGFRKTTTTLRILVSATIYHTYACLPPPTSTRRFSTRAII